LKGHKSERRKNNSAAKSILKVTKFEDLLSKSKGWLFGFDKDQKSGTGGAQQSMTSKTLRAET
jgi:hypothetical protein